MKSEILTKKFHTIAGKLVYYKFTGGEKDVIILYIHGLAPLTSRFKEGFTRQYKEYSLSEYSWIIPNLIGFGESEKPDKLDLYTMENQGQYLYELLLLEKIRNVIIMAHSMGGPIAISLIDKIKSQKNEGIKIKGLFYLEGNLDKNDAFFSSTIAKYPFEQFKKQFGSWVDNLIKQWNSEYFEGYRTNGPYSTWGSAYDLVRLSENNQLLPRLQQLIDFPVYFVFGEKNKGRFTSEALVKSAKLPVIYIPNTGHTMFSENPQEFWKVIKDLLKTCLK